MHRPLSLSLSKQFSETSVKMVTNTFFHCSNFLCHFFPFILLSFCSGFKRHRQAESGKNNHQQQQEQEVLNCDINFGQCLSLCFSCVLSVNTCLEKERVYSHDKAMLCNVHSVTLRWNELPKTLVYFSLVNRQLFHSPFFHPLHLLPTACNGPAGDPCVVKKMSSTLPHVCQCHSTHSKIASVSPSRCRSVIVS